MRALLIPLSIKIAVVAYIAAPLPNAPIGFLAHVALNVFHRVAMYLANTIPVIVARPFTLAGCVADTGMGPPGFGQMVVCPPLIGKDGRRIRSAFFDERLERLPIAVVADRQTNLAALTSHHASDGRTVVVPWPRTLFARRRGGSHLKPHV